MAAWDNFTRMSIPEIKYFYAGNLVYSKAVAVGVG